MTQIYILKYLEIHLNKFPFSSVIIPYGKLAISNRSQEWMTIKQTIKLGIKELKKESKNCQAALSVSVNSSINYQKF